MNQEEKQARLNQLKRIVYPSDQELEEMDRLRDEIKTMTNECITEVHTNPDKQDHPNNTMKQFTETNVNLGEGKGFVVPIQPQKKPSLLRKLLRVEPPKTVTYQEIEQLKTMAQAEELKARIRIAKSKAPKQNIIARLLGKSSYNPFDVSQGTSKKSKKRSDYNPWSW